MFIETINRRYQSLSPSFRRVADFVLTGHQRVAFMSASRLARQLGVDVATVTRFAQQLGYEGYTDLIEEIREQVLQEMRDARAPVAERLQQAQGSFSRTLWHDWANMEKTIRGLSEELAEKAMAALAAARRVYLVSEAAGAGVAHATAGYLRMVKHDVEVLSLGPFDMALTLKELSKDDVVVGIGFTAYAFAAKSAMELARSAGATTIGVISQPDCPVAAAADILFSCAATEDGYLPSPASVSAILFALFYNLALRNPDDYHRHLIEFQGTYEALTAGTPRGEEDVVQDLIQRF
jgi:DNA-binding MurR/RpiR family transcriptional regulator